MKDVRAIMSRGICFTVYSMYMVGEPAIVHMGPASGLFRNLKGGCLGVHFRCTFPSVQNLA